MIPSLPDCDILTFLHKDDPGCGEDACERFMVNVTVWRWCGVKVACDNDAQRVRFGKPYPYAWCSQVSLYDHDPSNTLFPSGIWLGAIHSINSNFERSRGTSTFSYHSSFPQGSRIE
jgi:hypothetical protein